MPDWTYQTVFRPLLFRLEPRRARNLALGAMGTLARLPLGTRVIQLMGHMAPDPRLAHDAAGLAFPSRVGIACRLDPRLAATPALAEFGVGFIEIGPVAADPPVAEGPIALDVPGQAIRLAAPQAAITPVEARRRLEACGPLPAHVLARIHPASFSEARAMIDSLAAWVAAFVTPVDRVELVARALADGPAANRRPLLAAVPADGGPHFNLPAACAGVMFTPPTLSDHAVELSRAAFQHTVESVRQLRAAARAGLAIIAAVGVHEPADALDLFAAGADLVAVDAGLVFSGPGLPKRINEAVLYEQLATPQHSPAILAGPPSTDSQRPLRSGPLPRSARPATQSWFWALLMGLAMLLGGVLAMAIALTRIVLPYDEAMVGLTRDELALVNCRLLPFMQHDRVTLAGTMLAIGTLYTGLALGGVRRGVHWAYMTIVVSAFAGFFSFFSFLGFGYFDPFHAFVTAILFQFLLLMMPAELPPRRTVEPPALRNDRAWRLAQWGQLVFVLHGAALIVAGLTISKIGMTTVFVPEDLEFMQTTAEELVAAHPRLVPLVAHDRATFGGMLLATGLATLLPALWGFGRGQWWLWWSLMLAGTLAYSATMTVHWSVGYHDLKHLVPAIGGLAWLWLGGGLSYAHLAAPNLRGGVYEK